MVHGSLRNTLLDIEREFVKRVLKHPTLSSRRERRAQTWDHSIGDKVAVVQAVVIQDVMIPSNMGQLRLSRTGYIRMLLNKRRLAITGRLGVRTGLGGALSLTNMRYHGKN